MPNIFDIISKPIKSVVNKSTAIDAISQPIKQVTEYWIRNNKITDSDLEEAKAVLFGEISNRSSDKQKLEAQTILNTAFNRMDEYAKRGTPKSLTEVLQMPNQYQAFGGKQYTKYKSGQVEELDKRKLESIDTTLNDIKNMSFQNNIGTSTRYHHLADGRIIATDDKLFK